MSTAQPPSYGTNPTSSNQNQQDIIDDQPLHGQFDRAGVFSLLSFSWITRIIHLARRKKLVEAKLDLPRDDRVQTSHDQFAFHWQQELNNNKDKPSLLRALRRTFYHQFVVAGLYKFARSLFLLLCAYYFVFSLIVGVRAGRPTKDWLSWVHAGLFFLSCLGLVGSFQQMSSRNTRCGIRVRGALITAVYYKALRLEAIDAHVSEVLALCSSDCDRIYEGISHFHNLWASPLESLAIIFLLWTLTGVSGLAGLGVLLIVVPLQFLLGHIAARIRAKNITATDVRVQIIHEILLAIKLVKLYAWNVNLVILLRKLVGRRLV